MGKQTGEQTDTRKGAQARIWSVVLRDGASLSILGTMMRSWCKKHTSGTKNDAHKHDTHDRGEVECKIQHVADYQVAHG